MIDNESFGEKFTASCYKMCPTDVWRSDFDTVYDSESTEKQDRCFLIFIVKVASFPIFLPKKTPINKSNQKNNTNNLWCCNFRDVAIACG